MADFLDSEAEESEEEEELDIQERKRLKKLKAVADSSEEDDEDDEERLREELKDLIDDNPIEDDGSDNEYSDGSGGSKKRKKHDDDDLDDRLEDDDYDLIEENLGVKVERRKRFKRLRRIQDNESDGEEHVDGGLAREAIAEQLFDENDESIERRSERSNREQDAFDEEETDSDADDFIVDDNGRPIAEKKKKRRPIFTDASLQEGQDIFGVDFDYDDFAKYEEDEYEDDTEGDDYDEDGGDDERGKVARRKPVKKKVVKKTIFDIYEPSELKRGHFTDFDNEVRKTDIPERMQLRQIPVTPVPEGSNELDEEAEWIYKHAFCKPSVSMQEKMDEPREKFKKPASTVSKIKQTLEFIRNQQLEVPFIGFYRKEYVRPELSFDDLWKIYHYDERWCQLRSRKSKLYVLFEKMRKYQTEELCNKTDEPLPESVRIMQDTDFERLQEVQSMQELKDVHAHFLLHYAQDIPKMNEEYRRREIERREELRRLRESEDNLDNNENGHPSDKRTAAPPPVVLPEPEEHLKQAKDTGAYATCRKAGLCGFAKRFGLAPEQYAENIRDSYQRNEVDQEQTSPSEIAEQYISQRFSTVEEVIHAVKYVVAQQLAREPLLRKTVREVFFERAKIDVRATRRGLLEIDENHPCYSMKFLLKKPVNDLYGTQFLKLLMAEEQKLIEITANDEIAGNTNGSCYIDEAKNLYYLDEFSKVVQEWNALRAECVDLAFKKFLIPDLFKELRTQLEDEAKQCVLRSCTAKLHKWLKVAPYKPDFHEDYSFDEWGTVHGIRALGIAYEPDISQAAFGAITNPEGDVTDYVRLPHILKRKNSNRPDDKAHKLTDLRKLTDFIRNKKPHVIVIGGESRDAQMLQADIRDLIKELCDEEQFPPIAVEIIDNELAKIYANSKKGDIDFRDYPMILKQAVSLARKMQDPLIEFSQLCDVDEEILCLRFHALQDQLPREQLLEHLYIEFINRTNEVGIDINMTMANSRTINLIQFICGLGARKGAALLKMLKQANQRLENRTQLVTMCHLGPKVFINCSGFIKIDTSALGDSTEAYVEVLDGSRVHPETYEWARKMAIDAMEYDDEETNPAGALEEILESPDRLKDLDLDAFAVELERQGFGSKSITLYDIRNELSCLYKDYREPFTSPSTEELFDMLTKETPDTFYVGKCIQAEVINIQTRKPQGDQLDQANPVRNEATDMWQCPFCQKDDFPELSDVWNHFDANACPGQAVGVKVRLENGLPGFIHIKNFSDKPVKKLEERVRPGQTIHVRIIKVDLERFSVDCSSKTTDLHDASHEWRPRRDNFYDYQEEKIAERQYTELKKKQTLRQQCTRRIIAHPSFQNKTYMEILELMKNMDQGEVVLRPSSKGFDHITATWKVSNDIYQHIDVREEGNENDFSVGRSLWIGNEEFEDLDEIIARHINPMAQWARELLNYKYYRDTNGGMKDKMEELLRTEKEKDPKKIHYFLSAAKNYPGKFLLSYLPKTKCRHEYVTVIPEGYRFRGQIFYSVNALLKWFKEHYADAIATPLGTPHSTTLNNSMRPPAAYGGGGGSSVRSNTDARSTYSHHGSHSGSIHNSSHYTINTPMYGSSAGSTSGGYINTPYTPSGQTPFMTPYNATPHGTQTPRYAQNVPSPSSSSTSHSNYNRYQYGNSGIAGIAGSGSGVGSGTAGSVSRSHGSTGLYLGTTPTMRFFDMTANARNSSANSVGQNAYTTGNTSKENLDWQLAADSWASRRRTNPPPSLMQHPIAHPGSGGSKASPMINDYTNSTRSNNYATGSSSSVINVDYNHSVHSSSKNLSSSSSTSNSNHHIEERGRSSSKDYVSKSARSTPRTNTSPRSMNLGDATPLYDEN